MSSAGSQTVLWVKFSHYQVPYSADILLMIITNKYEDILEYGI
jgi:hypothetical protein